MTMFIICCALAAAVLGLRYKVLVLAPAIGFALLVTVVAGIARADGTWAILAASAAVATVVQIGYLAGTLVRFTIAGARGARLRRAWSRTTAALSEPTK
jgi:hypothetical protein